jgi:hypothetical protein
MVFAFMMQLIKRGRAPKKLRKSLKLAAYHLIVNQSSKKFQENSKPSIEKISVNDSKSDVSNIKRRSS